MLVSNKHPINNHPGFQLYWRQQTLKYGWNDHPLVADKLFIGVPRKLCECCRVRPNVPVAEMRAQIPLCQFRPRLGPQPSAPLFVTSGPIICWRPAARDQAVWKPGAPPIGAEERISRSPRDPRRSLGRQEGRGSVLVGEGPGDALQGRKGVDEISGCAEVSFQPACLG